VTGSNSYDNKPPVANTINEIPAGYHVSGQTGQSANQTAKHHWQSDGLSSYPPKDPLVGQSQFYHDFESFIHLVDKDDDEFAHVFAMVAEWGRGKSRLGYELIAQINDASPGWHCRNQAGALSQAKLFRNEADREQYLGLYIRYSQIATEAQNHENWFAYGLYMALQPLAKNQFDGSIQSQVAKQCFDRLEVEGFDHLELTKRLELDQKYSDVQLYDDEFLATRLVNAAYDYLKSYGVKYLLVVLDELETAAEAVTYGQEGDDLKRLDGRAISLMGRAIKEEDPRRKLPWLRYVALCSPAIGEELREVSSLARRFNLVDLEHNAFSDVSDYVATLKNNGRLNQNYLKGLVEAAYAMSGGNFGWFNVIMAAVDTKLDSTAFSGETLTTIGQVFNAVLQSSPRIRQYVLDAGAISAIQTSDVSIKDAATELLFGQLPINLNQVDPATKSLTGTINEYDEPVASFYHLVNWTQDNCYPALKKAKFRRDRGDLWVFEGIEQKLDLVQLLANLATYAIHEPAGQLLIPASRVEFIELLQLLYPHGATEDAARALWQHFFEDQDELTAAPTHIGPSVAMLNRLNLRYRNQSQHSLIFKKPDAAVAHEAAMQAGSDKLADKQRSRLTGLMRVLDSHWQYDAVDSELNGDLVTIATAASRVKQEVYGLASCTKLQLHPKGRLVLAYVSNEVELKQLCSQVVQQFADEGKYPVLAVTSSIDLGHKFKNAADPVLIKAKDYLLLYRLSHNEEHVLEQVGLPLADCRGFAMDWRDFTSKFTQRLSALHRGLMEGVTAWRQGLHQRGLIAMPLRPSQKLNPKELSTLVQGWADLIVRTNEKRLSHYDRTPQTADDGALYDLVKQQRVPDKEKNDGFGEDEWSQLFTSTDDLTAQAQIPPFVCRLMQQNLFKRLAVTLEQAKQDWFFGYSWHVSPNDVYKEWMLLLKTALLTQQKVNPGKPKLANYVLFECSDFENRLVEAENWLAQEYPKQVADMADLFGAGRIATLFAPQGRKSVGAKTNMARENLDEALQNQQTFKQLEQNELIQVTGNWQRYGELLASSVQARFNHQQAVHWVYNAELYLQTLSQAQFANLDFEQDKVPLWQRIGNAKTFADQVYKTEAAVTKRAVELVAQIVDENDGQSDFPRHIFTRSLERVSHILAGAIRPTAAVGETAAKQQSQAGTLGFYLINLNVEQALLRLEQLAKEVGYDVTSGLFVDFDAIDGAIVTAYRQLKQEFVKQQQRAADAIDDFDVVAADLHNVPADYADDYAIGLTKFDSLKKKMKYVGDLFAEIKDNADELVNRIDTELQLGQFRLLREQVPPLLDEAKQRLTHWGSDIDTLKNFSKGYRQRLLAEQSDHFDKALNVLKRVNKQPLDAALTLNEIEAMGTLAEAKDCLVKRESQTKSDINGLLASNLISAERWAVIVSDMAAGGDAGITTTEAGELVARHLIVQTYRLGGAD
jgi:hypothetical protein